MTQTYRFINAQLDRPVVLVGMMGAGKTQIGKVLARNLNLGFADSDDEIVKAAGCAISDIFEFYGEGAFRDVEKKVLKRLVDDHTGVIATGGGAIVNDETREYLLKNTIIIWLDADIDTLFERVSGHTHRPLLQTENPKERLQNLLESRNKYYEAAHIWVKSENVRFSETFQSVMSQLDSYLAQSSELE